MNLIVHVVSDSTGDTAATIVNAVGVQFTGHKIYIRRYYNVRSKDQIDAVVRKIHVQIEKEPGLVVYTMASAELGEYLAQRCEEHKFPAVDLLGDLFKAFSDHFGVIRNGQMGAFHAVNDSYFRRIEAIEFTLRHDDCQNLHNLHQADLVLVGVSRTSKTPVSMYLAMQHGLRVANIALALGVPAPQELFEIPQKRIVGFRIQPGRLVDIRRARLGKMVSVDQGDYANEQYVFQELEMAEDLFRRNPRWPVIDVSDRSIEETATLVLDKVFGRVRLMKSTRLLRELV